MQTWRNRYLVEEVIDNNQSMPAEATQFNPWRVSETFKRAEGG